MFLVAGLDVHQHSLVRKAGKNLSFFTYNIDT